MAVPEKPAALDPELVQAIVLNAHSDFDAVRELVEREGELVNGAWDWGGGDWETGLGAAAHMGRRDIALFLLERGARLDAFAAAMLGEFEIVRAMLAAFPGLREARGPHGIPLLAHAQAGGEEARAVVDLLESAAVGR
jgi:hypothetical protein